MNDLESDNSALSITSFVFVLLGERKQRIYKLAGAKLFLCILSGIRQHVRYVLQLFFEVI